MLPKVLRVEMEAMYEFITDIFYPFDAYGQSEVFHVPQIPIDEEEAVPRNRAAEFKKFLQIHEILGMRRLGQVLREDMEDSTCFEVALRELPKKLVCMIVMLTRLGRYEMAHAAVNEILSQAKSDCKKRYRWSHVLNDMLERLDGWCDSPNNDLDNALGVMIHKRLRMPITWCEAPRTIEEAFYKCVWPGLELMYLSHGVTTEQLNKILIIAAQNNYRDLFQECLKRGADRHKVVRVTVGVAIDQSYGITTHCNEISEHCADHYAVDF